MRLICRILLLLALAFVPGGCVLPPAMVVASYSADIVSYAATGKTITDHAYSTVARSDCSFIRVLRGKPVCVDEPDKPQETQLAQAEAASPTGGEISPASGTVAPLRETYVRIGSFLDSNNAERARTRYAEFHAVIVPAVVHGQHFHRVVAGPLSPDEASMLKNKIVVAASSAKLPRG